MAIYSEQRKYIFFANPQTASKAISKTLRQSLDGAKLPERAVVRSGKVIAQIHHTTYSQVVAAELLSEEQLSKLFKFTCIRNPFDQLVSKYIKYCERCGNNPANYKWLNDDQRTIANGFPHWLRWINDHYVSINKIEEGPMEFIDHADLVIRFESLQEGFDQFLKRIGVSESLPVVEHNITKARADGPAASGERKKKRYTEYYDDASVEVVAKLYEPVIKQFGYRFGD